MSYEPRKAYRDYMKNNLIVAAVEFFGENRAWQVAAAQALKVVAALMGHRDGTPGRDVPNEPGSWEFAAVGDFGAGSAEQARIAQHMLANPPSHIVTVGDNVYPSGRWEDYEKNFDPPHLYGTLAKRIPFMPTLGNHDLYRDDLRPYFGHFPHLGGRPYYSFVKGNAHFISLDTDQSLAPGSAQYRWLENELRTSRAKWRIVTMHYPPFSSNDGDTELRGWVHGLLAKYGVHLVLTGHEHDYQRMTPQDGVQYVLTGGGGQVVYPFLTPLKDIVAYRKAVYHYVRVSVGESALVVRAVDEHGKVFDTVRIPYAGAAQAQEGATKLRRRRTAVRAPLQSHRRAG